MVPNLVVGAAFPIFARAARDDQDRLAYAVGVSFRRAWCWVAFFVALFLGAPFAIDVVAGEDFQASDDVLRIQAAALMLAFPNSVLFYVLLTLRRYGILLGLSFSILVVNVVLAGPRRGLRRGGGRGRDRGSELGLVAGLVSVRAVAPRVAPGLGVVRRSPCDGPLVASTARGAPAVVAAVSGSASMRGGPDLRAVPLSSRRAPPASALTYRGATGPGCAPARFRCRLPQARPQ